MFYGLKLIIAQLVAVWMKTSGGVKYPLIILSLTLYIKNITKPRLASNPRELCLFSYLFASFLPSGSSSCCSAILFSYFSGKHVLHIAYSPLLSSFLRPESF